MLSFIENLFTQKQTTKPIILTQEQALLTELNDPGNQNLHPTQIVDREAEKKKVRITRYFLPISTQGLFPSLTVYWNDSLFMFEKRNNTWHITS